MPWTSCCRDKRRNCPSISLEPDFLLIRDDFDSVVRIPRASVHDLVLTIQQEETAQALTAHEQTVLEDVPLT